MAIDTGPMWRPARYFWSVANQAVLAWLPLQLLDNPMQKCVSVLLAPARWLLIRDCGSERSPRTPSHAALAEFGVSVCRAAGVVRERSR
jgi:hypothetical protein